ncbi:hypothetical protein CLOSYM_03441 [[Clostridium] symbiosum ATCC 14940]|uniref:Uncharacterized protein n=1 Tax=[Clostridium] symbiosum ATCC 14940 TaxID=411472 RepID=A0ABC9TUI9_CLOSY|nr:hypothetical protein CLOSYM_03441 [[Clostridium] symbiosum ATCC 14940]
MRENGLALRLMGCTQHPDSYPVRHCRACYCSQHTAFCGG